MKLSPIVLGSVLMLAISGVTGCTTAPSTGQGETKVRLVQQPGDRAFESRRQAMDLRELARRYELEATALAAIKGAEHEDTLRSRGLAKTFWAAADEADQAARAYRRQIPHNRVY